MCRKQVLNGLPRNVSITQGKIFFLPVYKAFFGTVCCCCFLCMFGCCAVKWFMILLHWRCTEQSEVTWGSGPEVTCSFCVCASMCEAGSWLRVTRSSLCGSRFKPWWVSYIRETRDEFRSRRALEGSETTLKCGIRRVCDSLGEVGWINSRPGPTGLWRFCSIPD